MILPFSPWNVAKSFKPRTVTQWEILSVTAVYIWWISTSWELRPVPQFIMFLLLTHIPSTITQFIDLVHTIYFFMFLFKTDGIAAGGGSIICMKATHARTPTHCLHLSSHPHWPVAPSLAGPGSRVSLYGQCVVQWSPLQRRHCTIPLPADASFFNVSSSWLCWSRLCQQWSTVSREQATEANTKHIQNTRLNTEASLYWVVEARCQSDSNVL